MCMMKITNNCFFRKSAKRFAYRQWDMKCFRGDSESTCSWRKQRSRNSSPCCTDRKRERLARCSCPQDSWGAEARESRVHSKIYLGVHLESRRIIDDDSLTLRIRRSHLHLRICPHRTPRIRTLYCRCISPPNRASTRGPIGMQNSLHHNRCNR